MEVHHHSSPAPGGTHTARKKWTHYFWEFLMLFLAVFCGFLAENQREHYIEHKREKEFAVRLLADLRADSAFYFTYIEKLENAIKRHETFTKILTGSGTLTNHEIISNFYRLLYIYTPELISATFSQMKTSGSLRYIQNPQVISALQIYYEKWQGKLFFYDGFNRKFFETYLYPFCIDHFLSTDVDPSGDSVITVNPVYLNRTKESDIRLLNILDGYRQNLTILKTRGVEKIIPVTNDLITLLKKEYHLK